MNHDFVETARNGNPVASETESFANLVDSFAPSAPDSFADLINDYNPSIPRMFQVIEGFVTGKDKNGYRVDHGGKSESFCPDNEAGEIQVGRVEKFVVLGPAMSHGRPGEFDETSLLLSHKRIQLLARVVEMKDKDEIAEAVVIGINRSKFKKDAGLDVRIGDITAFVPREELLLPAGTSNLRDLVGQTIPVMAELPQAEFGDRSKHVFSHKKAVIQQYLSTLRVNQQVDGEVVRYSYRHDGSIKGAVVRIAPGVTGFVPNALVSYNRDRKTEDALPIGARIKATVDEVTAKKQILKLSTRKATVDWELVKACTGVHEGAVFFIVERTDPHRDTRIQPKALIRLENGLTAFCLHADVTPRSRVSIGERIPKGTRVKALVKDYDRSSGQIKVDLSPMSDPILELLEGSKGQVVTGKVMSAAEFGYFIGFDNGDGIYLVDGLCHKHKLKKIDADQTETLNIGDIVKVRVENVMRSERTVSLTRKDVDD